MLIVIKEVELINRNINNGYDDNGERLTDNADANTVGIDEKSSR